MVAALRGSLRVPLAAARRGRPYSFAFVPLVDAALAGVAVFVRVADEEEVDDDDVDDEDFVDLRGALILLSSPVMRSAIGRHCVS